MAETPRGALSFRWRKHDGDGSGAGVIAVVSPAKSLDLDRPWGDATPSEPAFAHEADVLATAAAKLTAPKLMKLMGISDKLAALNVARYRGFAEAAPRPAIFTFAGDVYQGFDIASVDGPQLAYAQDHLRILSGLYGLLRPLDRMRPYRLEMGTGWAPGRPKDLYAWWGNRIADRLAADAAAEGSGVIVNVASQEYWKAVAGRLPDGLRVIAADFREDGPKGLRFNSFAAKRARGMMARWIVEHRPAKADDLKAFDSDGYAYVADGSDDASWRFVRNTARKGK